MITLITGSLVLSILHALIPNHWLPVLAIGRRENWSLRQTTSVTIISGGAHALSTVLIGLAFGFLGVKLSQHMLAFAHLVAPVILIALGVFFIYQHHRHQHFHLHNSPTALSQKKIIAGLVIAMFFSPCFEIEAFFLMAGAQGWQHVITLALLYTVVTVTGMVVWVRLTYQKLIKLNWHSLEHNSGIITGATLVITGIASFFIE